MTATAVGGSVRLGRTPVSNGHQQVIQYTLSELFSDHHTITAIFAEKYVGDVVPLPMKHTYFVFVQIILEPLSIQGIFSFCSNDIINDK